MLELAVNGYQCSESQGLTHGQIYNKNGRNTGGGCYFSHNGKTLCFFSVCLKCRVKFITVVKGCVFFFLVHLKGYIEFIK